MSSNILADNGVSSGSAGIKTTADSSGVLALQTTTAGGAATTAVTIDTSQNMMPQLQTTPPSLTVNGQMVMNLTSNTNLRISVRGSDGTTRVANITLA
jgi:acyl-coenzyme A thioesterase PaaI-like protein